jgi:hypothetical protein
MLNKNLQQMLIDQGLLDPPADGQWGPQSRAALALFQELKGLVPTGEPDEKTRLILSTTPPKEVKLGADLAGRVIREMRSRGYWISCGPARYNIVYLEGCDRDGRLNNDAFNEWNDRRLVIEIPNDTPKIVGNWLATTEPGRTYTDNPLNPDGAFRIAFGQYRAWQFGRHGRTQYPALVQVSTVFGHRDGNRDGRRTGDLLVSGDGFGINQHHGWDMEFVNEASAGCLVGQSIEGHEEFMAILRSDRRYKLNPRYTFYTTILAADELP